jgi:hypothetical protein
MGGPLILGYQKSGTTHTDYLAEILDWLTFLGRFLGGN